MTVSDVKIAFHNIFSNKKKGEGGIVKEKMPNTKRILLLKRKPQC